MEKEAERAFGLHKQIEKNELIRRALLMENMKALAQLKEDNLYRLVLGNERAPWVGYLALNEVFYTRNEVNNYIRIYNTFVRDLEIDESTILEISRSRLFDMLPIVDETNVEELISMAKVFTTQDWNNEMRVRRGKTSIDECSHTFEEFQICADCGTKHRKNE